MNRKIQHLALLLLILSITSAPLHNSYAQARKDRKSKRQASKSTPPAKSLSRNNSNTSGNLDIGIEIIVTKLGRVIVFTNREKVPVTIRKIMINEEYDYAGNGNLLHSTRSWTTLPVELSLGDTLRVPVYPYEKAVIYIDIETDKGKVTYKVDK